MTRGVPSRLGVTVPLSTGDFVMYGIIYGVKRTTIYFSEEMKAAIEREAARRGVTEAAVIRTAVESLLSDSTPPSIVLPLFDAPLGFDLWGRVADSSEAMSTEG